jgi:hypothetical protein
MTWLTPASVFTVAKTSPPQTLKDVGETHDLAAVQADMVANLQSKWDAWNATLSKPLVGGSKLDDDGAEPGVPEARKN